jgi:hypothetical protein
MPTAAQLASNRHFCPVMNACVVDAASCVQADRGACDGYMSCSRTSLYDECDGCRLSRSTLFTQLVLFHSSTCRIFRKCVLVRMYQNARARPDDLVALVIICAARESLQWQRHSSTVQHRPQPAADREYGRW